MAKSGEKYFSPNSVKRMLPKQGFVFASFDGGKVRKQTDRNL